MSIWRILFLIKLLKNTTTRGVNRVNNNNKNKKKSNDVCTLFSSNENYKRKHEFNGEEEDQLNRQPKIVAHIILNRLHSNIYEWKM